MEKRYLDIRNLKDPEEAHVYLKQQLNFPDYYGKNLDALYDCLCDLHDLEIIFTHIEQMEEYGEIILSVFQEAAREEDSLLVFLEKEKES